MAETSRKGFPMFHDNDTLHPRDDGSNDRPDVPVVPGLEIVDLIARGGHGSVYRARQVDHDTETQLRISVANPALSNDVLQGSCSPRLCLDAAESSRPVVGVQGERCDDPIGRLAC